MATEQMSRIIPHLRRAALLQDGGDMTDGQLLGCFLDRRDEAAFEALVRRHGPMVLGVCRRVLGHVHDAEDAFQATFLLLVRKAASLGSRELVGNWLYGVAYRTALEARAATTRKRSRERQVSEMPERAAPVADRWSDLRPLLDQELSRLPDHYRLPVVLCDLEGRTRKEVARQLGVPEGTLSSRLTTARRRLAKRLARHGLALSGGTLAVALSQSVASGCVPASLVISTIKAATLVAAGQAAAAGVLSTQVAALMEGVLKTMFLTKLKIATVVLLAVGVLGTAAGVLTHRALADQPAKEAVPQAPGLQQGSGEKPAEQDKQKPPEENKAARAEGLVKGVDADKNTITLTLTRDGIAVTDKDKKPVEQTFDLANKVSVYTQEWDKRIEGLNIKGNKKVADLTPGMYVHLKMSEDKKAVAEIREYKTKPGGVFCYVQEVDADKNTITVNIPREKKIVTFDVTKNARVLFGIPQGGASGKEGIKPILRREGGLNDLKAKDRVYLYLSEDKKIVVEIRNETAAGYFLP